LLCNVSGFKMHYRATGFFIVRYEYLAIKKPVAL